VAADRLKEEVLGGAHEGADWRDGLPAALAAQLGNVAREPATARALPV